MNAWAFRLRPIADFLRRRAGSRLGWGALASIPGLALAGPTGENVVAGGALIHRPDAVHTQVDQSTTNAIVNWNTFSVDNNEYVIFNQPGANASILNRVVGSQQSQILGQIQANGRVFLVNPQGVYFAPGAKVDVGSLTASVLDITNANFMSGNYEFTRPANAPDGATVENAGEIKVSDGGYVVLAGDYANNTGIISARLGQVVLAAGSKMTLDLSNDGLVSFAVDEATVSSLAGVNNAGQVFADGGQIIMTAKVANDLVATAVNNDGLLQAHRIVEQGGEIYLSAAGGNINHAGTIDVAAEGNQSGGAVTISGDEDITLTAGSKINANGSGTGNGGTVNVIADGKMAFRPDAEITALAGAEGDRGGRVELSGHEGIQVRGDLALGKGGALVIDPPVVTLTLGSGSYGGSYGSTLGVGFVQNQLNSSVNVSISASSSINASPGVNAVTATGGSGALTFRIIDNNGSINLAGLEINILGSFTASAGSTTGNVELGKVSAGNVRIIAGLEGDITLTTGGIVAASTSLLLSAGSDITIGTPANPGGVSLVGWQANIDIDAGGDLVINGNLNASATEGDANVDVDAQNITINDVIVYGTSGADIVFNAEGEGDITVNNVEAEIGSFGSYGGGDIEIDFTAGSDIVANNIEAHAGPSFGSVDIQFDGRNVTVNNVTATASNGSVFVELWADNNLVVKGTTTTVAAWEHSISYSASNTVDVRGNINATETSDSYVDIYIWGKNGVKTKGISAIAANEGSVYMSISASTGDVLIDGPLVARSTGNDSFVEIYGNNITTKQIEVTGTSANLLFNGTNLTINGNVNVTAQSFAEFRTYVMGNTNILGNTVVTETGEGFGRILHEFLGNGNIGKTTLNAYQGWVGIGSGEGGLAANTTLTGDVTVNTQTYGNLWVSALNGLTVQGINVSGMSAAVNLYGNNVSMLGPTTIMGTNYAGLYVMAMNNLNVPGAVTVKGNDNANATYFHGNAATFGQQTVTAGAGQMGYFQVGNSGVSYGSSFDAMSPYPTGNSAVFDQAVNVSGGLGGQISVFEKNQIRTQGAGILSATAVTLGVANNGTTEITAKTRTESTTIANTGMTPNVSYDNTAFAGPSTVNFASGTLLNAASFFATGPLTFNGAFTASNLAVSVTNGTVTFNSPVQITGANPFLATAIDGNLFSLMADRGLTPPTHGPDVQIFAQNGITINQPFKVNGTNPYTKMFSNGPFDISGLTTDSSTLLAVFSPIDTTRPVFFEDQPFLQPAGASAFFNYPTIFGTPNSAGTTIVIGEMSRPLQPILSGPLTIGSNGSIDIGSRNMFIITRGAVTGDDRVLTTGIFEVIGLQQDNFFEVPVVTEFGDEADSDEDDEDDTVALGEESDDEGDGDVAEEDSSSESMECS